MLRPVALPPAIPGQLFLSRMPGRYGPFAEESQLITDSGIDTIVCLTPLDETRRKSPDYASVIDAGELPWGLWHFPVEDFGVPNDREGFLKLARDVAAHLRDGRRALIHCGAGIGRTGTLAACVLIALGMSQEEALQAVGAASAGPETSEQMHLVEWFAETLG